MENVVQLRQISNVWPFDGAASTRSFSGVTFAALGYSQRTFGSFWDGYFQSINSVVSKKISCWHSYMNNAPWRVATGRF